LFNQSAGKKVIMHATPFHIAVIVTLIILLPDSLAACFKWGKKALSNRMGRKA
jgi:hypothetical protein